MLTTEQMKALNDVLMDYWHEMEAPDIVEDVIQFADPLEAAKYLERAAADTERTASELSPGEDASKEYYRNEATKFRRVAQLLRQT